MFQLRWINGKVAILRELIRIEIPNREIRGTEVLRRKEAILQANHKPLIRNNYVFAQCVIF